MGRRPAVLGGSSSRRYCMSELETKPAVIAGESSRDASGYYARAVANRDELRLVPNTGPASVMNE